MADVFNRFILIKYIKLFAKLENVLFFVGFLLVSFSLGNLLLFRYG